MSLWLYMVRLELLRTLREGNTLVYLAFPLVAYPLMIWGGATATAYVLGVTEHETLPIAARGELARIDGMDDAPLALRDGDLEDLDARRIEALVEGEPEAPRVHHRSGSSRSQRAAEAVEGRLGAHMAERMRAELTAAGGRVEDTHPLTLETASSDAPQELLLWILGMLAATLVPTSIAVATLSPASELFVAERERLSLETTLTSAVPRAALASARLAATATLGLAAGCGNLLALAVTLAHSATLIGRTDALAAPSLASMAAVFGLLAAHALGVSLMFMFAFTLARTFREAQNLASPLLMVLLGPTMVGLLAMITGSAEPLWWVPMVHTSTLLAAAVQGTAVGWQVAVAVGTDVALVAMLFGAWTTVMGAESLLVGLPRPAWVQRMTGEQT